MSAKLELYGRLIIETFDGDVLTKKTEADNVICLAGLTGVAAALSYLGVEDIAGDIDSTPAIIYPVYGAIGTGDVTSDPPAMTDTQLVSELSRATISAQASAPAIGTNPGQVIWQFQFPINNSGADYTITEAGIFVLANGGTNSGDMFDHAAFNPVVTWPANQSMILSLQLSLYAVSW